MLLDSKPSPQEFIKVLREPRTWHMAANRGGFEKSLWKNPNSTGKNCSQINQKLKLWIIIEQAILVGSLLRPQKTIKVVREHGGAANRSGFEKSLWQNPNSKFMYIWLSRAIAIAEVRRFEGANASFHQCQLGFRARQLQFLVKSFPWKIDKISIIQSQNGRPTHIFRHQRRRCIPGF